MRLPLKEKWKAVNGYPRNPVLQKKALFSAVEQRTAVLNWRDLELLPMPLRQMIDTPCSIRQPTVVHRELGKILGRVPAKIIEPIGYRNGDSFLVQ